MFFLITDFVNKPYNYLLNREYFQMLYMLYLCRGVCAASGLCLPAVPKGQTDKAGVPDSLLPGSLCSCWCGFSLCHLPDIHRLVQIVFQKVGRLTSSQILYMFCTRNTIFKPENETTLFCFFCTVAHYTTGFAKHNDIVHTG